MRKQLFADVLGRGAVVAPPTPAARVAMLTAEVRQAWANPFARRGTLGMALVATGSLTPAFLPKDAPLIVSLKLQWLSAGAGRFTATLLLVAGMALLVDAWLRLRPRSGSAPLHRLTWLLWSLPVLLAPPLFSRDAYSYAAQGQIIAQGMNPYEVGPVYVPGPFRDQVDPLWLFTPAPYGPLALQLQHFVVTITGDNAYVAAVAMRVPALIAVGLMAWAVPRLAERLGVSRDRALWLGVLNPLVMMHLVGGSHGDAMMIAFVAVALLLASRGQLVLASISIATAASFKQTAVLALIGVIGMAMQAEHTPHRSKLGSLIRASALYGLISAATFALITAFTGLGWGWIANLSVPVSLRSLLSPSTLIGSIVEGLMRLSGLPASLADKVLPIAQGIGLMVGVVAIGAIMWRIAPRKPVLAAGLALLTLCATGPVVHPWYLLWGGVILAATRLGPRSMEAMIWVSLFLVTYGVVDATLANGTLALGITVAVWMLVRMLLQRQGTDPNDPTDLLDLNRDPRATSRQRSSSSALG
ncbi:MAG: polyprenol phosphomannose-dependent alpha 1,6 mannosyltransferase MptB [Humibacillus sp.]|nr:polyprenol phosphomannose-dependent alpha 1,6 mannosyltransferase MptB [Humibacillus sp.]